MSGGSSSLVDDAIGSIGRAVEGAPVEDLPALREALKDGAERATRRMPETEIASSSSPRSRTTGGNGRRLTYNGGGTASGGDDNGERVNKRPRPAAGHDAEKVSPPPRSASNGGASGGEGEGRQFRVRKLAPISGGYARTNDDVHASINLCPATRTLLDTPQMQRLRGLKQLGASEYVYINATHNRFEHSLGVAHLAERMCRRLASRQPQLGISEKDVLCVKIAGLFHDVGHGPFSHVFDGEFQRQLKRRGMLKAGWSHEEVSLRMFDAALATIGLAIDEDSLDEPLRQIGDGIKADCFGVYSSLDPYPRQNVLTSRDMLFAKECILGGPLEGKPFRRLVGRPWRKEFLYNIVNNSHSGFDVDKMDYYTRDMRRALGSGCVDVMLLEEVFVARVTCNKGQCPRSCQSHMGENGGGDDEDVVDFQQSEGNGEGEIDSGAPHFHLMICFPTKMITKLMDFFKIRFKMHTEVYTHKAEKAHEFLLCRILILADPYVMIPSAVEDEDGVPRKSLRISEAMHDPDVFLNLRDSIIDHIALSTRPELAPARELIRRLRSHDQPKCLKSERITRSDERIWNLDEGEILADLISIGGGGGSGGGNGDGEAAFGEDDLIVEVRRLHHGKGDENPVNSMRFLSKEELVNLDRDVDDLPVATRANEEAFQCHIPISFLEKSIRIFCCDADKADVIRGAFDRWLAEKRGSDLRKETLTQLMSP